MLKKADVCKEICRKVRVTRTAPAAGNLSKRELLLVNSCLDVLLNASQKAPTPSEVRASAAGRG
jgi:hypothetical protein